MAETPLYQDQVCYGLDLRTFDTSLIEKTEQINIKWLQEFYAASNEKELFFDFKQSKQIGNFDKLAGTANLRKQIIANTPEADIRKSWEPALAKYKEMRKKYLLYK